MRTAARNRSFDGLGRLLALFAVLAVLVAVPFALWGDSTEALWSSQALVETAQGGEAYAFLVIVGLLVADIVLPVPNTAVIAAAGILYGPLFGGAAATVGLVASAAVGYGVSRRFGRPVARWLIGEEGLAEGERLFATSGGFIVAGSRWLPIVPEVVSCMAGLARMPLPRFLLAVTCGAAPLGFAFAAAGYYGAERPLMTLALAALVPLPVWYLMRRGLAEAAP